MGETMRRYWLPACASSQIAAPDSDPLRVRLLGENFVAFRDTSGQVGVLDELCMHRGASLALGRVEECGIRCLYHGWKFSVDGTIQETPNHSDARFRERFTAPAYPVHEQGGLVWVYLGPRERQPPLPGFPFMLAPEPNRSVIRVNVHANYLQLIEGGIDSSHVGILHSDSARPDWANTTPASRTDDYNPAAQLVGDLAPTLEIENTDFGLHYAAIRRVGDGRSTVNIRITPFILPFGRIIPPGTFTVFEVPADDEHTSTFLCFFGPQPVDRERVIKVLGLDDPTFWQESDCTYRASWEDGFKQDRGRMRRRESWSGLHGLEQEDATISLSMGPIFDRSREHIVPADRAVIRARRLLFESMRRVERGEDPIGAFPETDFARLNAPDQNISLDERWQGLVPDHVLAENPTAELEPVG
jgi:phenylpropionate dioxygenase-like ring-hydroxylating dioxygenase large terminal subunit